MNEGLFWTLREAFASKKPGEVARRQRARFAEIVAYARANSPYYHEFYRGLPEEVDDPRLLPVTSKKKLMARFDDWVTDRDVNLAQARAFVSDPDLIGEPFLGKYMVATTSGTTGTPGIILIDKHTLAVTTALAMRMLRGWINARDIVKIVVRGARLAIVMATGSHFASAVAAARLRKSSQRRAKAIRAFSAHTPLAELVSQLNQFRPAVLAPYASVAMLLAGEQEARRLRINPVLLTLSAEGLRPSEYDRIARVFNAKVGNSYAATECTFLSYSCREGWLHVNSDWVLIEPVGSDHQPTPPGERSHTVLVSNLANRVQPILRYDLGDSVLQRPDPCPCGNPLPAIRVQGRAGEVLTFRTDRGDQVAIPPLGLELDDVEGLEICQIVQTSPTSVRVRLLPRADVGLDDLWKEVQREIKRRLDQHGLDNIKIERADESPKQSTGGKYRAVIPLGAE